MEYHLYQYVKYLKFQDYHHFTCFLMISFQEEMEVRLMEGIDFLIHEVFHPDLELNPSLVET